MNERPVVLWADDEIELLKPYLIFLNQKGYDVVTANSGRDAISLLASANPDIVFLDENMPGISGLETLQIIKERNPVVPIVMITKSEEENIMEQAIGSKIADYLIKPVNPNQILMTLKKHVSGKAIVSRHATASFRDEFQDLSFVISSARTLAEFMDIYQTLVRWSETLQDADDSMRQLLSTQYDDANKAFAKLVRSNYQNWLADDTLLMSHRLMPMQVMPRLNAGDKVCLVVIDNFRYDQWRAIYNIVAEKFHIVSQQLYCTILPTATQYARNSIFSALMPLQIKQRYPQLWVEEGDEDSKNQYEKELLNAYFQRNRRSLTSEYYKINESAFCEKLVEQLPARNAHADMIAVVVNFIDMLSHSRTESQMMRELAADEQAYLSLTKSWFQYSPTIDLLLQIRKLGYKILITTDHGTKRVTNAVKVVGDKNTNVNLRYKVGKSLAYNDREVVAFTRPEEIGLPAPNVSSHYIFAQNKDFLAYPNNYNYYVGYYRDTFQHGGISLEEMLVPLIEIE